MSAARILIADVPAAVAICRPFLAGRFELVHAPGLDEAIRLLQGPVDLVLCGVHFDEGNMYDLLRHVKGTPALAQLPFVAVRCVEGQLDFDGSLRESVHAAVRALGGDAVVDLLRWQHQEGSQEAGMRFSALLQQLARPPRAPGAWGS